MRRASSSREYKLLRFPSRKPCHPFFRSHGYQSVGIDSYTYMDGRYRIEEIYSGLPSMKIEPTIFLTK